MTTGTARPALRRRSELGRLISGSLLEMGIKAYGVGAATSVALGEAETVGGKGGDAIKAVPTLADRYEDGKYVVEHREEIRTAVDYLKENTPDQAELTRTIERSEGTLRDIRTTYDEVGLAKESVFDVRPRAAAGHIDNALDARPSMDSIHDLADAAEQLGPVAEHVQVLLPVYYGAASAASDNFASDEIVSTLFVMGVALALSFVLGRAVGFWVRRGRPGLIARWLQRLGARRFRGWYVRHLPEALGDPVYEAARERVRQDIVANPEEALDEETLKDLEEYFAIRLRYAASR